MTGKHLFPPTVNEAPELISVDMNVHYDKTTFQLLLAAWSSAYAKNQIVKWRFRVLFRSLEMAYHAASIPFKNNSSIYDYGASISLWVSAFEILLHDKKYISLNKVLDKIGNFVWHNAENRKKSYKVKIGRGKKQQIRNCNFPQKIYYELYKARCNFLHGEPTRFEDLLLFRNRKCFPLNHYSPLLYKAVLYTLLKKEKKNKSLKDIVKDNIEMWGFEDALINGKYRKLKDEDL